MHFNFDFLPILSKFWILIKIIYREIGSIPRFSLQNLPENVLRYPPGYITYIQNGRASNKDPLKMQHQLTISFVYSNHCYGGQKIPSPFKSTKIALFYILSSNLAISRVYWPDFCRFVK